MILWRNREVAHASPQGAGGIANGRTEQFGESDEGHERLPNLKEKTENRKVKAEKLSFGNPGRRSCGRSIPTRPSFSTALREGLDLRCLATLGKPLSREF